MRTHQYLICTLVGFVWQFSVAQQDLPINSNYLIENGISPRVLDAAASELLQEGSFIQNLEFLLETPKGNRSFKTQIIQDPKYKDGKDLRFVIKKGSLSKNEIKQVKKAIEKSHKMSRLSRSYLYDESTLKLISSRNNELVLGYKYSKKDVEPELKDIKRLSGKVFIKEGILQKVELKNDKKLSASKDHYIRTVFLKKSIPKVGISFLQLKSNIISKKKSIN